MENTTVISLPMETYIFLLFHTNNKEPGSNSGFRHSWIKCSNKCIWNISPSWFHFLLLTLFSGRLSFMMGKLDPSDSRLIRPITQHPQWKENLSFLITQQISWDSLLLDNLRLISEPVSGPELEYAGGVSPT